jgi:hypothetical protein
MTSNSNRVRKALKDLAPHLRLHPDVTEEDWGRWLTHWGDFLSQVQETPQCPTCGAIMRKRSGRYGEFWGCSRYPKCRHTINIRQ